jgi:hypothetical protein
MGHIDSTFVRLAGIHRFALHDYRQRHHEIHGLDDSRLDQATGPITPEEAARRRFPMKIAKTRGNSTLFLLQHRCVQRALTR